MDIGSAIWNCNLTDLFHADSWDISSTTSPNEYLQHHIAAKAYWTDTVFTTIWQSIWLLGHWEQSGGSAHQPLNSQSIPIITRADKGGGSRNRDASILSYIIAWNSTGNHPDCSRLGRITEFLHEFSALLAWKR